MKQLTCEMCGGTDLIKQDGVFVCQSCGCKYSVEEARKMMIEGTVEVQGTVEIAGPVQVDTSVELNNLYQIARRARDDNNHQNAAKYYDMVKMKDPTSWEASFYQVYFTAMSCKVAEIKASATAMANCQRSVFSLIKEHILDSNDKEAAIQEVITRSAHIANVLCGGSKNWHEWSGGSATDNYAKEYGDYAHATQDDAQAACAILFSCGDEIETIFGKESALGKTAIEAWKYGIELTHKTSAPYNSVTDKYAHKIGTYDETYLKKYFYKKYDSELNTLYQQADKAKGPDGSIVCLVGGAISTLLGLMLLMTDLSLLGGVEVIIGIFCVVCWYIPHRKRVEVETDFNNRINVVKKNRDSYR